MIIDVISIMFTSIKIAKVYIVTLMLFSIPLYNHRGWNHSKILWF